MDEMERDHWEKHHMCSRHEHFDARISAMNSQIQSLTSRFDILEETTNMNAAMTVAVKSEIQENTKLTQEIGKKTEVLVAFVETMSRLAVAGKWLKDLSVWVAIVVASSTAVYAALRYVFVGH